MPHLTLRLLYSAPIALVTVIALEIELRAVGWQRWSIRRVFTDRDRSRITDAVFFAIVFSGQRYFLSLFGSFGFILIASALASAASDRVQALHLSLATHNGIANAVIYMALFTFCDYWFHRLMHFGPFWPLHRFHHSATPISPLTTARIHPLQIALEPLLKVWPLVLCPVSIISFLAINAFIQLHAMIQHIDARWTWGWFGRWVLVSPVGHRIHHSPMPEHFNRNLSFWPVWDHLFGTWYKGTVVNDEVGIGEPLHNNRNLLIELGTDLFDFGRGLIHWTKSALPLTQ